MAPGRRPPAGVPPRPPWLLDLLERLGPEVRRERMGVPRIRRRWPELSVCQARRLARAVREDGGEEPSRTTWAALASRATTTPTATATPTATTATPGPFRIPEELFGPTDILAIGDPHAVPQQDQWRFRAAAKMAAEFRPPVIWCAGDWPSFDSLSRHATPAEKEGQRLIEEIEWARRALDLFEDTLARVAPDYRPRRVLTRGNHCEYPDRMASEHPALIGSISSESIGFEAAGWEVHPFKRPIEIGGALFCHYFQNAAGKPIGGKYAANTLLNTLHQSAVWGHSHRAQWFWAPQGDRKIHALNVGCFTDGHFDYLGQQGNRELWRGLWLLRNVQDGDMDPQPWRIDIVRRRWG